MDFIWSKFGDGAAAIVLAVGTFAYRGMIGRMFRYSADFASRLMMLSDKVWHHNLAVRVRHLLWVVLAICLASLFVAGVWMVGATALHVFELYVLDSPDRVAEATIKVADSSGKLVLGGTTFWPQLPGIIVGFVVAVVALLAAGLFVVGFIAIAIWRLRGVRSIPVEDLQALFNGLPEEPEPLDPNATPVQQTAQQQAVTAFQAALQAAEARILQILRDAGPSGRLGTLSFLALILPFLVSGAMCGLACASLYTWVDVPWHYGLVIGIIATVLLVLGCFAALFVTLVIAKVVQITGATVNWFLRIFVRQGALATPGIVDTTVDHIIGKIEGLPTGPAAEWIKELFVSTTSGVFMVSGFFIFYPDARLVLILLSILLVQGLALFWLERRAKLNMLPRVQKSMLFFDGVVMMILIVGRSAASIGMFVFGWTSRDVRSTVQTIVGWTQGIIGLHPAHACWIFPVFGATAAILFFTVGSKVEKKLTKAVVKGLSAVFAAVPLVLLIGLLIQACTDRQHNQIQAFGLEGPPVVSTEADAGPSAASRGIVSAMSAGERGR